jgi:hypothetical protein
MWGNCGGDCGRNHAREVEIRRGGVDMGSDSSGHLRTYGAGSTLGPIGRVGHY